MNWPFKIFDNLSWTGRSGNKEARQIVKRTSGRVQQAGRDIHNYSKSDNEQPPLLFINSLGWSANQSGVSLAPDFFNGSSEVLFIESLEILGEAIPFEITVKPQQNERPHLPTKPYPASDDNHSVELFYRNAANNRYRAHHTVSLQLRDDGKFNYGPIKFQGPIKKLQS